MSAGTSVSRRRSQPTTRKATTPVATPPTEATTRSRATEPTLTPSGEGVAPWAARPAAASAVRSVTRAVASLSSDSPSRMVVIFRGRPIRRATAVAATASGGATIAPRARASAKETGRSHHTTRATPRAVKSTSPTERLRIFER